MEDGIALLAQHADSLVEIDGVPQHHAVQDQSEGSELGLVLNCTVLWNTFYTNRALEQLRAPGYPVLDADAARLSAFIRAHIGIDGHYAIHLPDFGGDHRRLRDPDAPDDGN
ncbi:Tn3 family transposase [Nocardia rhamnosiphila]|uniref:Tn3 family transposase n=1 Tax=Nocardia rhamnosiphila TaxID=426716 RepID=UPI003F4CC073